MDQILNSSPDGIWIWDGFGRVIAVNKTAEKYGAVKEEALIGKSYLELIREGIYDRSVAHNIFKTKKTAVVQAESMRTGIVTMNTGTPHVDHRGEIFRIVVKEQNISHLSPGQTQGIQAEFEGEFNDPAMVRIGPHEVVARNHRYRQTLGTIFKLAGSGVSKILVLGESGTGKGLLARLMHEKSPRRDNAFVQLNCAAVPENLLEAELFGYEGGAFTGAKKQGKAGLFEIAHGGTLFLDEIGELPLPLQAKLLKYLDDFQIMRLCSTRAKKVDCTMIAATNCDLKALVEKGRFREDLLYRINAFTVRIPPLKERPEDIFGLVTHFLEKYNKQYGQHRCISPLLVEQLQAYPFPGNVRELKNIMKRVVVLGETNALDEGSCNLAGHAPTKAAALFLKEQMLDFEKKILIKAMSMHTTTRAMGEHLGIDQSSVVRKLKKHGLTPRKKQGS
ncbi:MAG: sigma 54-interacting transcriptional regulator [Desulfobacterium sp.]|nr:sigma 54-interacting transcriptional regulator [Desulfobacterium sp.]